MARPLYWVGAFSVRYRYAVVAIWILGVVALALGAHKIGSITSDNLSLPGYDSQKAHDLLAQRFPSQANGSNPVVLRVKSGTITDQHNASVVNATVKSLQQAPHVTQVVSPLTSAGKAQIGRRRDGSRTSPSPSMSPQAISPTTRRTGVVEATAPAENAGFDVGVGGYLGTEVSQQATEISEVIGIAAAIVILLFAFGTAVAMGLPIVTAILGLIAALSLITFLGHRFPSAQRQPDARHDDRARSRDRLCPLHCQPTSAPAGRGSRSGRVRGARGRHIRGRGRLRRHDGRDRSLFAQRRRDPVGHHAGLHRGDLGGRRRPRGHDAAPLDLGNPRPANQLAESSSSAQVHARGRGPRLGALGAPRLRSSVACADRRARRPRRARLPDSRPDPRPAGHQLLPQINDRAQGL